MDIHNFASNKNDTNDALAIAERLVKTRAGDVNQLRGLLSEYGVVVGMSITTLMKVVPDIVEDANNELASIARSFVLCIYRNIQRISVQIEAVKIELVDLIKGKDEYALLQSIPGIGPIISAALMASVGVAGAFKNGRQLAAWIGLTSTQYVSGETNRMGKISKRGNSSLRKYLIHGACTVLN